MTNVKVRKRKADNESEEAETNEHEYQDSDSDVPEPEEWHEDDPTPNSSDHQQEFKVLGQQLFKDLNKINVTSSWVDAATTFPADLSAPNLADLEDISRIPKKIFKRLKMNIKKWFPVQKCVLPQLLADIENPPVLRPRDVTISAPTGSGKTMCYILPVLCAVGKQPMGRVSALVIAPVQTLVKQIEEEFTKYNAYGAIITALSGAEDFEKELRKLHDNEKAICKSDVIIATPGRIVDHLTDERSTIDLSHVSLLVVDEADRMGSKVRAEWLDVVEQRTGSVRATTILDIANSRSAPRKILLSATLSRDIEELFMWNLHRPCLFRATVHDSKEMKLPEMDHISGRLALPASISHSIILAQQSIHPLVVYQQLQQRPEWKRIMIFTNEKMTSHRLCIVLAALADGKFKIEHLTSELFGRRRVKVLRRFKTAETRVLICSDVLSRGVDVNDVDCVINYEIPANDRLFLHRAGRTGRAGKSGFVLSIADKDQKRFFKTMLNKTGLWTGITESSLEQEDVSEFMEVYQNALKGLQSKVENTSKNGNIQKQELQKSGKVSGLAYRRPRKWDPNQKAQRESASCREKWKKKSKTK